MAKTLIQINQDFEQYRSEKTDREQVFYADKNTDMNRKHKRGQVVSGLVSNLIFYGAIALLIFAAVTVSAGDNTNGSVLGYRYYHILSGSMERVYPKGSFVIVKESSADEIKAGDDITFYAGPETVVTHRVIDVVRDFDGSGATGYQTQGTESLNPDPELTHEANVAGKVVFSIPRLGLAMDFIREHMLFVFGMFFVAVLASFLIRMIYRQKTEGTAEYL